MLVACALSISRVRSLRIDMLVACVLSVSHVRSLRIYLLVACILSVSHVRSLRIYLLVACIRIRVVRRSVSRSGGNADLDEIGGEYRAYIDDGDNEDNDDSDNDTHHIGAHGGDKVHDTAYAV